MERLYLSGKAGKRLFRVHLNRRFVPKAVICLKENAMSALS